MDLNGIVTNILNHSTVLINDLNNNNVSNISTIHDFKGGIADGVIQHILPLYLLIPTLIMVPVLVVAAIVANGLVLVSYCGDRRLRTVSNLYLLHLAVCDLSLAMVSMPLYLVYTSTNFHWPLGRMFCKVFLVTDYTLCAMSVYLVTLISWDMLLILRQGVNYGARTTRTRAYAKIIIAWILAFLLYSPAIVCWDYWRGHSVIDDGKCNVEFHMDRVFTFITVVLEFLLPSIALMGLNLAVYREIRKRTRVSVAGTTQQLRERVVTNLPEKPGQNLDTEPVLANQGRVMNASTNQMGFPSGTEMLPTGTRDTLHPDDTAGRSPTTVSKKDSEMLMSVNSASCQNQDLPVSPIAHFRGSFQSPSTKQCAKKEPNSVQQTKKIRSDLKAARTLFIFMIAFIVHWAPYSIASVVTAFCESCVNPHAFEVCTWLLWMKSVVNPFLYAAGNARFKNNFMTILGKVCFCCRKKRNP
ncbi:hypothetical protein ACOMHN_033246 [Nucella lapillus]